MLAELRIGEMRRLALGLADAEIDRRLAEMQRHQLRMDVGDVQDRHRAERIEAQDVGLRQPLLRGDAAERTEAAAVVSADAAAVACRKSRREIMITLPRTPGARRGCDVSGT